MPMPLSEAQKKQLRGRGHQLKPVVMIGEKGLSKSVLAEYEACLVHHELIKVRVKLGDRQARDAIIRELCELGSAELVQRIGNMALLYRQNPEKQKSPPRARQT